MSTVVNSGSAMQQRAALASPMDRVIAVDEPTLPPNSRRLDIAPVSGSRKRATKERRSRCAAAAAAASVALSTAGGNTEGLPGGGLPPAAGLGEGGGACGLASCARMSVRSEGPCRLFSGVHAEPCMLLPRELVPSPWPRLGGTVMMRPPLESLDTFIPSREGLNSSRLAKAGPTSSSMLLPPCDVRELRST